MKSNEIRMESIFAATLKIEISLRLFNQFTLNEPRL